MLTDQEISFFINVILSVILSVNGNVSGIIGMEEKGERKRWGRRAQWIVHDK